MTRVLQLTALALMTTMLTGCVVAIGNGVDDDESGWQSRQQKNDRYIRALELGQSRTLVEAELGRADFYEAFQRQGDEFEVLYYRTHRVDGDGRTTKSETTPLVFVDEVLIGWGDTAVDNATR